MVTQVSEPITVQQSTISARFALDDTHEHAHSRDMATMITNEFGTDITIRTAEDSPGCTAYRREERYASHTGGACVNLTIEMKTSTNFYVRFSYNRGNGWQPARRSKETFTSEAAARAFADRRWTKMLTWVRTVEPKKSTWQPDFTNH